MNVSASPFSPISVPIRWWVDGKDLVAKMLMKKSLFTSVSVVESSRLKDLNLTCEVSKENLDVLSYHFFANIVHFVGRQQLEDGLDAFFFIIRRALFVDILALYCGL